MAAPAKNGCLLRGCAIAGLVFLVLGIGAIVCGIVLPGVVRNKLHEGILENIVWTPHSPASVDARYRNNSFPGAPDDLYRVWLFNISNLDDVRQGAKPILVQVGPYVHRAYREKHEVLWSYDGRVRFKDYNYYTLDTNLTTADPTAPIATFNLALLGVLAKLHAATSPRLVPFADLLMQIISSYQDPDMHGLFVVKPALELLWGYEDKLLKLIGRVAPAALPPTGALVSLMQNVSSLEEALAQNASIFNTGQYNTSKLWNVSSRGCGTLACTSVGFSCIGRRGGGHVAILQQLWCEAEMVSQCCLEPYPVSQHARQLFMHCISSTHPLVEEGAWPSLGTP
eukprot:GHUV01040388.1.p1 GENE.GHUV01040388.1~~GHUV01040388.1.p1  ORF type:complete len:340 (+),score=51.51 GHUV01040388.1:509-1528(+)